MNAALQAQLAQLAQIHQLVMKNSSSLSQMQQQLQERVTSSCLSHHEPPAKRAHLLADDGASDDILDAVFSFVGVEEYLFAAGVSRKWRVRYLKLCYSEAASETRILKKGKKLRTGFTAVTRRAARLQVALDSGLTIAHLQECRYTSANAMVYSSLEPVAVLALASQNGLQWTDTFTNGAARRNDLQLLQWLVESGCPCDISGVGNWAVEHGNMQMLQYAHSVAPLPTKLKETLLTVAGEHSELPQSLYLQYLRSIGVAWPATFYRAHEFKRFSQCWTVPAVQWALANGCTWGSWKCQLAQPADYPCKLNGLTAADTVMLSALQ
jgi:hypothetical protein